MAKKADRPLAKKSAAKKPAAKRPAAKKAAVKKAAGKTAAPRRRKKVRLESLSDVRRHFIRNSEPHYFISATNFNLLNMDEWVRGFRFINYIDCFDGQHPNVFVPGETAHEPFESIEDINNYLLSHKEVRDYIKSNGPGGKAVFLMFNKETEELCRELGLELVFPPAEMRDHIDDKINATRIAKRAGVPCVPNWLGKVSSYNDLRAKTKSLGKNLVIQTPFGDSGHTTFFISSERDFAKHAKDIVAESEVKVMKRIRCHQSAAEACVTRHGTIVGPLMTELVGFDELTPYKGGWCGNEVFGDPGTRTIRTQARKMTFKFGEELRKMGYRGYFELDFLTDMDDGKVYLGEVNPRITGASSMTNLSSFAHADAPLFLFHLLEWSDTDFELEVEAINDRWSNPENIETWGQLVIKHTYDTVDIITQAPPSGVWKMREDGSVYFHRVQYHRRSVESEDEAFFLRISGAGDYRYEGADLGILITPGRLMDSRNQLTKRAKAWITGIKNHYQVKRHGAKALEPPPAAEVGGFKLL